MHLCRDLVQCGKHSPRNSISSGSHRSANITRSGLHNRGSPLCDSISYDTCFVCCTPWYLGGTVTLPCTYYDSAVVDDCDTRSRQYINTVYQFQGMTNGKVCVNIHHSDIRQVGSKFHVRISVHEISVLIRNVYRTAIYFVNVVSYLVRLHTSR